MNGWRVAVLAALLSGACCGPAAAATRFGVDLGANFSRLDYDQGQDWWTHEGWRISVAAGASMEVPLTRTLGLATGLRFVRHGSRIEFDKPDPVRQVGEYTIAQDYFTVPLLLTVRPRRPGAMSFSLGPELGVLVAAALDYERTFDWGNGPIRFGQVVNLRDEVEPVVLLGTTAVAWEVPRGTVDWCLQARSTFGLTRASEAFYWTSPWRTFGIEMSAGLRW